MPMPRRTALKTVTLAAAGAALARELRAEDAPPARKGRIRHSVCKWCFGKTSLEDLAAFCAAQGIASIELVGPKDWPVLKKHGLICAMTPSHGIVKGLNRKENHAECLKAIRDAIEATAAAGFPNVICFSGNRGGMGDEEAWANCAEALKQVTPLAEDKGVTLCMELLNSKRSHADYHCDRTTWGVELCKRVGSPRFKLLYDIFHMQIMEGDVIDTIREHIAHIGHIHTAGVPGRNEIDETQELCYPPIMKAIADLKFSGYVAQEFIPKRDPLTSLRQAIDLCDV
jgi:hydroxypyruvate isomerase